MKHGVVFTEASELVQGLKLGVEQGRQGGELGEGGDYGLGLRAVGVVVDNDGEEVFLKPASRSSAKSFSLFSKLP